MKTDSALKHDVSRELAWDARVNDTAIGVSARHGVVTLTGSVSSWAEKHAAEDAAHRVADVFDVANDITITPIWSTAPSDTDIAEAVRSALAWHRFVPHEQIHSTVANHGMVTLTGSVQTLAEREEAEHAIRNLQGVHCVINQIAIEPSSVAADALQAQIKQALVRHVAREADRIGVEIRGDTVVVSGPVGSWVERRAVVGAAKGTPGVKHVEDRLQIAAFDR